MTSLEIEVWKRKMLIERQAKEDWDIIFGAGSYQRMLKAKAEGAIVVTDEVECGVAQQRSHSRGIASGCQVV